MSAAQGLPLAALVLYLLRLIYFDSDPNLTHANVIDGLLTALTPLLIVTGDIVLFKTMEFSGAMNTIREWLNKITSNRVEQLMLIAWSFSFLIEGISGFGTPAVLAGPLLLGLGYAPLSIAIVCLIMNSVPVSFGAVGMPTWFGFYELNLSTTELQAVGFKTALIHGGAHRIEVWASPRKLSQNQVS